MGASAPRVLLLSMRDDWLAPPRLAQRLIAEGLEVAALCSNDGPFAITAGLRRKYGFSGGQLELSLARHALEDWQPHRVLPMDHDSVLLKKRLMPGRAQATWLDKHASNLAAARAGLNVPEAVLAIPGRPLPQRPPPFPLILKPRTGYAGSGMAMIRDAGDLQDVTRAPYEALLQRYVPGETWTFGFCADRGRLVAGFAARKVRVHPAVFGPSSQLEIREQPAVREAARRLIEGASLDGLGNMDCQVDADGCVWFLECNPRPPPFLHLGLRAGPDPLAALADVTWGRTHVEKPLARERWLVALWPQDKQRDPDGRDTNGAEWDVPEDPALREWIAKKLALPDPGSGPR
jgi:hypothetical protein